MLQSVTDNPESKKTMFLPEKEIFMVQDEIDNEKNDNENFLNAKQLRDEKLHMS